MGDDSFVNVLKELSAAVDSEVSATKSESNLVVWFSSGGGKDDIEMFSLHTAGSLSTMFVS